ncbi:type IV secretory system conjugative DNA transfer family protein [Verrucosispora sp. NA02020]|uniref:type IV secretory system conjugative DNA transfer family protein n=1 Tax=Verrucosispora sp. NA02020 TaxID=2742132 RepID=UPI0015923F17|nr:type IV secretory system conjugative DNA transfer family protein [Verrucosispora sp. NA02020]QKW17617.1 ATP-binding protein [Verrucosispora sp. NA02020]
MSTRTVSEVRADRMAALGRVLTALLAAVAYGVSWLVRRSWRRLLPLYWIAAELAVAWLAGPLGLSWQTVALLTLAIAATAAGWQARSRAVRMWRAAIAVVLGTVAVATVAAGGPAAMAAHPTATIFLPTLFGVLLGWPWWHHLRTRPPQDEPMPAPVAAGVPTTVVDPLTDQWSRRWRTEVIGEGVCAGTTLVKATEPRPGVTEALIRLAPKTKPGPLFKSGPDVEVALDLDEGAVGWRSTGKTAWLRVVIVERSYIGDGVPWHGPTYEGGRCEIARFTDGSPGQWVLSRPNFGVLGGLVVGSSGSGKTRALGALNANLLEGGFQVVVGDPQNGQSLPAWRDAVEYHAGVEATSLLLRRFHAEVMRRSALLADAGVDTYDENDPRVKALGLGKLMVVVDECQLVLIPNTPLVPLVEQAAETMRKTGAGLVLATQLPQMRSLGGSVRLRDALVAGNALVLRLSNRGSGTTILPDDFVGDPFAIEREIDGKSTAGMGYLRHSNRVGMLCRVPHLDEVAAAAASPRVPVRWNVEPIDPNTPIKAPRTSTSTANSPAAAGASTGDKLRAAFGIGRKTTTAVVEQSAPQTSAEWVLACLRRGPASAQALLDRPDCPVNQAQLYALLNRLKDAERIVAPAQRGGPWTVSA